MTLIKKNFSSDLCLFILFSIYALFFYQKLAFHPNEGLFFRDLGTLTLPSKKIIAQSLVYFHELPLWNPFTLGGSAFLSDPSFAAYYPLNIIFYFFPLDRPALAMSWFIILHLPIILMGFYKAFQKITKSKSLAVILAITIGGSGFTMSSSYLTGSLSGLISLGWTIYFLLKFFEKQDWKNLFCASLFIALPILGGDPQYTYIISLFIIPLLFLFSKKDKHVFLSLGVLFFLSILVAAPQIIPTMDLLISSNRAQFSPEMTNIDHWSLHPIRLLELFYSLPLNISSFRDGHQRTFVNGPDPIPFILSIYPGFLFFPLLLLSFFRKRKWSTFEKSALFLSASFLLISLGNYIPFSFNLFLSKVLPVWGSFRYPERLTIFTYLFLGLFIAKRFENKPWQKIVYEEKKKLFAFFTLTLVVAVLLKGFSSYSISYVMLSGLGMILTLLGFIILAPTKKIVPYAIIFILCIDLCSGLRAALFTVPTKIASAEWIPFLRLLKDSDYQHSIEYSDRFLVLDEAGLNWTTLDKIGAKLNNDVEKLSLHQFLKLAINTGVLFDVSSPLGYVTLMNSAHKILWDQFPENEIQKFLSIKGTKFIGEETPQGDFSISTNPLALPILRAPNIVEFKPKNLILSRMKESSWDWNQSIIIEDSIDKEIQQINDVEIKITHRSFRDFTLDLFSKQGINFPLWIHWNETFSKYLQFEQGNLPLETARANFWSTAFRVHPFHAGKHITIHAKYQNPLIPLGQSLFYVWLGMGLLLTRIDRKKRLRADV